MAEGESDRRLAVIETTVLEIKHRLLGNGQPGEIQLIHERVNGQGRRLSKLENWRWWVVGIAVGLGFAGGGTIMHIIESVK